MNLAQPQQLATMTLVLTPRSVGNFGRAYPGGNQSAAVALFQEAIEKCFRPAVTPRFVPKLDVKWKKRVVRYSKFYGQILETLLSALGPSWFRLEYVKQLTGISKELDEIGAAAHDVRELFRRHVVCCANIDAASGVEFTKYPDEIEKRANLLWESNYGITLLILLLHQNLSSSLQVLLDATERADSALSAFERELPVTTQKYQLSGSLELSEGNFHWLNEKEKR